MTREETKKILMAIECSYANWKPKGDLGFMVDIWCDDLADYSYEEVYTALKAFKATNTSGFAPDVGQLIDAIHKLNNPTRMTELEAWSMVSRAICDSTYHAEERFNEFPEEVKRAVGSPNQLRIWATDENYNDNVVQSNFIKSLHRVEKDKRELERLPASIRERLALNAKYQNYIGGE